MKNLRIFLYSQNSSELAVNFVENLHELADSGIRSTLDIAAFTPEEELSLQGANLVNAGLLQKFNLHIQTNSLAWTALATDAFLGSDDLLLFISADVRLHKNALLPLIKRIEQEKNLIGVNPLFIYKDYPEHVLCLGITADICGRLHYLYEGLPLNDSKAKKRRAFQLAHPAAFLLRGSDFTAVNGFKPACDELTFFDLCIRLRSLRQGYFSTEPASQAVLASAWDSWLACGLWNSLLTVEKLPPDLVSPDYWRQAQNDDLAYGIDEFVNEYIIDDFACPQELKLWLDWRKHPNPATLLKWLKSLPKNRLIKAIECCRSLPVSLPRQMLWYNVLAKKIKNYAEQHNLTDLQAQVEQWQKKEKRFHYSTLKRGIEDLFAAGLYKCGLDNCPAIFDAWLEISSHAQPDRINVGADWPCIAIVMPFYNPNLGFFKQALESVQRQNYNNWQLCIADDCSTDPGVRDILETFARDKRFKIVFRQQNGHISLASNSAMELVTAPWTTFLDHDDLLTRDAMLEVAKATAYNGNLRYIFSDSDHINVENIRRTPVFNNVYDRIPSHLTAYATEDIRQLGGFRQGYEGSQDYDLMFRVTETITQEQICHIPRILYHWRVHSGSTSFAISTKPYVLEATKKVLLDSARRKGYTARIIETIITNLFNIAYELPPDLDFGIILLTDQNGVTPSVIEMALNLQSRYGARIYCQPLTPDVRMPDGLIERKLEYAGPHWAMAANNAAIQVDHDFLLYIYGGLTLFQDCRPEQLVFHASEPGAAVVGGMIWKGNLLWHGGLYPDISGLPFPLLRWLSIKILPWFYWGRFLRQHRVIGVAWQCMAVKRDFILSKNFDAKMGIFAEADFSLALEKQGLASYISPWGQWQLEPNTANLETAPNEQNIFLQCWADAVATHGLRNPNLKAAGDFDWTLIF